MKIRAFKQEDLPAIFDIYSRSKLDELKYESMTYTLLSLEDDDKRFSELMESDIYVCHEGDFISGYGAIFNSEIRALFVHPKCRGKGIGKQLLEFLLFSIKGQAILFVARSNESAKHLYHLYGFKVTDTFLTTYNQVPVVAQRMVRPE
ncbi:GNAT family N-acetyltransferase [Ketobacter sp. MCCC 1A13808]|uniref:GNAT family N-acetyltransferase n=1 Tax=Ketobacter sp. MCCC 1A13808 TaxID=2602738 RepID=UPI0012EB4D57|nr:GNAT family N-acetyltransferase [Ketobacter sp. MCCC 1A13808]MVF14927.1 GNAT family N-acetyltransferase [Ketobacter sp. MCCC 1A13808]